MKHTLLKGLFRCYRVSVLTLNSAFNPFNLTGVNYRYDRNVPRRVSEMSSGPFSRLVSQRLRVSDTRSNRERTEDRFLSDSPLDKGYTVSLEASINYCGIYSYFRYRRNNFYMPCPYPSYPDPLHLPKVLDLVYFH